MRSTVLYYIILYYICYSSICVDYIALTDRVIATNEQERI
jgi:hypothetical protein